MELIDFYEEQLAKAKIKNPHVIILYCYLHDQSEFEMGAFVDHEHSDYLNANDYYYNGFKNNVPIAIKK